MNATVIKKRQRTKMKIHSPEWNQLRSTLLLKLKKITLASVREATKYEFNKNVSINMYYDLKKVTTESFQRSEQIKVANQLRVEYCWLEADTEMAKSFTKMVGLSRNKSLIILLRSFALAVARSQIDIVEIVPAASKLSNDDILLMANLFRMLNISDMLGPD